MNNIPVLTVGQINTYIKSIIDGDPNLNYIFVVGEISNFTNHYRTGHYYFTLKDESSAIKAVMFRSSAQRIKFVPENGMRVILRGRVSVFERDGQYQLYVDDMQPDGAGALNLAFEQLKARLEAQGLFDASRKKPIPEIPERVGVITSPTGAAVRDILNVLGRRFPLAKVVFCPVQVQGVSAAPQIAQAIDLFNRYNAADVLIVGRGGGSIEDLWAFSEEQVALAVSRSSIPVISAVGHETDFTICDFVADLRAPTPSAAAELAVPDRAEQRAYVSGLMLHASGLIRQEISEQKVRVNTLSQSRVLKNPLETVEIGRQTLDSLLNRLLFAQKAGFSSSASRFAEACAKLDALSPLKVLSRGYAAVYSGGKITDSAEKTDMTKNISVRFADGEIECKPLEKKLFT
ncbi:MAG: exodeoxyribonuclease VII large subunit [Clostridia bacterium]|nr:exodeoxyribonuclease VII large subunit [Clostridia bacterium]